MIAAPRNGIPSNPSLSHRDCNCCTSSHKSTTVADAENACDDDVADDDVDVG